MLPGKGHYISGPRVYGGYSGSPVVMARQYRTVLAGIANYSKAELTFTSPLSHTPGVRRKLALAVKSPHKVPHSALDLPSTRGVQSCHVLVMEEERKLPDIHITSLYVCIYIPDTPAIVVSLSGRMPEGVVTLRSMCPPPQIMPLASPKIISRIPQAQNVNFCQLE